VLATRIIYTMVCDGMTELLLFTSTFLLVFALGLRRGGPCVAARIRATTQGCPYIGGANLVVLRLAPNASPTEIAAYLSGGPLGILCAMKVFAWQRKNQHENTGTGRREN